MGSLRMPDEYRLSRKISQVPHNRPSQLIGVHVANINRKINLLGLVIVSARMGRYGARYTVQRVISAAMRGLEGP
jgi:hypothetical protein